jgi:hypothetical protein
MRCVAAFRTHLWDNDIATLAERFFAAAPSCLHVVLMDETRAPVPVHGYEKLSHTNDTASLHVPNYPPDRSLWFNADYALYFLLHAYPDADFYLMSEADVAVNIDLRPMLRYAAAKRIDFIAHEVEPSTPRWFWHPHGLALSPRPWRSLVFFMLLSRRAILSLLAVRQTLAKRFAGGDLELWPFCEAFIPTTLKTWSDMRFAPLGMFATTENFKVRPHISLHDPRAAQPGSLVHSVIGGARYVSGLLGEHPARAFLWEGSDLHRTLLREAAFVDVCTPLRKMLSRDRDHAGLARLYAIAAENGWAPDPWSSDLAFCKPARTSSVSGWSRTTDPAGDAAGANGELLHHDYAFHTGWEDGPWWAVDLLSDCTVHAVAIVNRVNEPWRFRSFQIDSSYDGATWTTRFVQAQPVDVASDPATPFLVRFADPFHARHVRIVLVGEGVLHLRRVQVFGAVDPMVEATEDMACAAAG